MAHGTSNTKNTGVMHAVIKFGSKTLCGNRRAIMATEIAAFRESGHQCARCAAKLAEMDGRVDGRKIVGVIDLTPTWTAVLPVYLAALVDGSDKAKSAAREELYRMAAIADGRNIRNAA